MFEWIINQLRFSCRKTGREIKPEALKAVRQERCYCGGILDYGPSGEDCPCCPKCMWFDPSWDDDKEVHNAS